jgi:hypothetical protein
VRRIDQPALFYLDGHYSGGITARAAKDTPIYEELSHIFEHDPRHVIVIDDARCFGRDPDYPSLHELREFIPLEAARRRDRSREDDSIRNQRPASVSRTS